MPSKEFFELHPTGWHQHPEEERFKLTTLDYLVPCVYVPFAVFFRIKTHDVKGLMVRTLREALENTLSQVRHLCGTIEKDADGGHSFVKRKHSTVQLVVQRLDGPMHRDSYPSIDDLEKAHFRTAALGDLATWTVAPMTYGEKPEAHLDASPKVAAFQVNFVQGGMVLVTHHHHSANDVMGWAGFFHQLAENCKSIWNGKTFPSHEPFAPWDAACLDLSRLSKPMPPETELIDGPCPPQRHADHTGSRWLLFHLPKSNMAELKKLAWPTDPACWISSYDAYMAMIWRCVTRVRFASLMAHVDPSAPLIWGEAVNMRTRMHSPSVPSRTQQNVVSVVLSPQVPSVPWPSASDVMGAVPLGELAWYIRQLTNSTTQESLDGVLAQAARVRDKAALALRLDSFPPGTIFSTDWRSVDVVGADFGFARPLGFRVPNEVVTEGLCLVYPPRACQHGDEGPEFMLALETDLLNPLLADAEWSRYFEFRGVDTREKAVADGRWI